MNTFGYGLQNPIVQIDPYGESVISLGGRVILLPIPGARVVGGLLIAGGLAGMAYNHISDADKSREIDFDPTKPIPPQLPGWMDPETLKTGTGEGGICPPEEPKGPDENCADKVQNDFILCSSANISPAVCWANRVKGWLMCAARGMLEDPPR